MLNEYVHKLYNVHLLWDEDPPILLHEALQQGQMWDENDRILTDKTLDLIKGRNRAFEGHNIRISAYLIFTDSHLASLLKEKRRK